MNSDKKEIKDTQTHWHLFCSAALNNHDSVGAYTLNLAEGLLAQNQLVHLWSLYEEEPEKIKTFDFEKEKNTFKKK